MAPKIFASRIRVLAHHIVVLVRYTPARTGEYLCENSSLVPSFSPPMREDWCLTTFSHAMTVGHKSTRHVTHNIQRGERWRSHVSFLSINRGPNEDCCTHVVLHGRGKWRGKSTSAGRWLAGLRRAAPHPASERNETRLSAASGRSGR